MRRAMLHTAEGEMRNDPGWDRERQHITGKLDRGAKFEGVCPHQRQCC